MTIRSFNRNSRAGRPALPARPGNLIPITMATSQAPTFLNCNFWKFVDKDADGNVLGTRYIRNMSTARFTDLIVNSDGTSNLYFSEQDYVVLSVKATEHAVADIEAANIIDILEGDDA